MNPNDLEKWSFMWSEVRLLIAALALFLGGTPPVWLLMRAMPALSGITQLGLTLCWIISGAASVYLAYRYYTGGQKLFGANDVKDMIAFFVLVVSGINLGLAGVIKTNIGMSITTNYTIFLLVGVIYILAALYLYSRWNMSGKKIF